MSKRAYKPVSDRAKAEHGEDVVELDLSPVDELDAVNGGHLEIVPGRYEVLVDNFDKADKGSQYEAVMFMDVENALIGGGVLKRVEDKPSPKRAAKKSTKDD